MFMAAVHGMELADPGITTEPRDSQHCNPGRLIFSRPLLSLDAVRPWPSSIAAVARGDAAQAAFDRKLTHHRNEIGELRQKNIHYRPRVWTADGRPHPYAADIASSRNGRHLSAKSLHRRWKHEIQIALLRRRVALRRHHRQSTAGDMSPPLTVGLVTTTSTTLRLTQQYLTVMMTLSPLASCTFESVQPSSL